MPSSQTPNDLSIRASRKKKKEKVSSHCETMYMQGKILTTLNLIRKQLPMLVITLQSHGQVSNAQQLQL